MNKTKQLIKSLSFHLDMNNTLLYQKFKILDELDKIEKEMVEEDKRFEKILKEF